MSVNTDSSKRSNIRALVVADEFTVNAFSKEWIQTLPTPSNYKSILDAQDFDLVFIESAWAGNNGEWKYQLVGKSAPRPEIKDLISIAKAKGIPVMLWNKEDPPHFEDFLPLAELVDYVFTTEGSLIPEYKQRLGHDNIFLLPFAAQSEIHNPANPRGCKRNRNIAFGGMYFRDKYPERREQMEYLLPAAAQFDLDIFSRQNSDPKYQFPQPLNSRVVGSLKYPAMVGAYHLYKSIINVNSVADSDTMCARRIFEATACGTAVVSPPSGAIDRYFPNGLITVASDMDEATTAFKLLTRSDEYRERLVHKAQRHLWENHLYSHRLNKISEVLDLDYRYVNHPYVSIFITTNRPSSIPIMVQNVVRQEYHKFELVLLTHGFEIQEDLLSPLRSAGIPYRVVSAPTSQTLGANLNQLVQLCEGEILVRMDDDDWYGPNYTRDQVNALKYSDAAIVGKAATYMYFEALNQTVLTMPNLEHRYTDLVRGATFCAYKDTFDAYPFPELGSGEDSSVLQRVREDGAKVYSSDRFNFIVNRWADKTGHTWRVSDSDLYATGALKYYGNGQDQVIV
ncbi:hypothetical protein BK816_00465 [Boudabousia tangfeifanii]|uniref:Glycosyltransferase n=1 Tax=Boudabousia tangfeifanii TaxID=1912795 RepID=A0A1D9MM67_9ACTO|nr:hypothetical protein BK816_00465 [Boudabousia tangfeifanii]